MTKLELNELLAGIHRDVDALASERARESDNRLRGLQLAARSLRQAESTAQLVQLMADAAAPFARAIAFFRIEGTEARCEATRGMDVITSPIPLSSAPAFRQVVETKESVVSLIATSQLGAAGTGPRGLAHLFPLAGKTRVLGIMMAVDEAGPDSMGFEVLLSLAAAALELRAASSAVLISAATPAPEPPPSARRFARSTVAGWMLESPELVSRGRATGNLYEVMGAFINSARSVYRERYLPGPDYLHEEIVERLVLGKAASLGSSYPGKMGAGNDA